MKGRITVLLVDDHPVVLEGLRAMLASDPSIEVVGEAHSGEEALQKVSELQPRVVLMDIRMPGMSGTEATQQIKKAHSTTAVIVLTIYDSEPYVVEAIRCGAAGYLTKDSSRELLCHALRAAVDGGTLVRSGLLRQAIRGFFRSPKGSGERANLSRQGQLSPRELEVLQLLTQGHGNKAIAAELGLAEVTVKKHIQGIIGKLGVSDRTHAAVVAVQSGLVG